MSVINKIPRSLRALVVIAILGILVWKFAYNTDYYYYCLGAAILIAAGLTLLIYQSPPAGSDPVLQKDKKSKQSTTELESDKPIGTVLEAVTSASDTQTVESENIPIEDDILDIPPKQRGFKPSSFKKGPLPSEDADVPDGKLKMSKQSPEVKAKPVVNKPSGTMPPQTENSEGANRGGPPVPLIEDHSSLSEEDKNDLVNAVWYRCENPYCKYTSFLGVHHILDEKDGGTNRLDNLIVLCPYCHDLAHRGEIPEKEMRAWISRDDRFKSKPQWRYY